ncbi:MAG: SDR family oxidoreductase [Gracilibacteraceae bacterium]|jgi:NAD(P)-dependent dehydrogenase (short-subunit alcohol dehydrogenase family)|nr:SDR family oxidoreductase [Gracilibacteraceae bacterium]
MNRLKGKVAIVTGAARGMGEAYARLMALEGARVMMTDLRAEVLEAAAANIRSLGGDVTPLVCDASDIDHWRELTAKTVETYGGLNVLVNNAGFATATSCENFDQALWDKCLGVILYGTVYGIHCAVPEMRKAGGGSIINVASMTSFSAFPNTETPIREYGVDSPYCAAKGAVVSLTRAAAWQYAPDNIRVNAIAPGIIDTPIIADLMENPENPIVKFWRSRLYLPSGFGQADEVAWMGVFLASDEASHVTGVTIPVDGGYLTV